MLFGAGTQARAHLDVLPTVRPFEQVTVVSRSAAPARRLVEHARAQGLDASVGTAEAYVRRTSSAPARRARPPVFDGALLPAGVHVNAVGAFTPEVRELDDATVRRGRIVVEERTAALAEAGDLIVPLRAGIIGADAIVADLFEVCRGEARVRESSADLTVFKSVGLALEDLAIVAAVAERLASG